VLVHGVLQEVVDLVGHVPQPVRWLPKESNPSSLQTST
jgi:hypothetical protein